MDADHRTGRGSAARLDLGGLLAAAEAAAPVDAVEAVAQTLQDMVSAESVSFLIADFSGDALLRLGNSHEGEATRRQGTETAERVSLVGTPHGRALAAQTVEVVEADGGAWLYAPVTSRGEAVGVLELRLRRPPDEHTVADVAAAAHALAYVVIANRRYTDLFEWGQRSVPLSLAAEIQHRLLPGSYTCEAAQFTLAAWLEPAGEVGGDTFDFSLDRDRLFVSITDAMGHTVGASLLATLIVGSMRNGRRRGADLAEMARLANAAINDHADPSQFVTGQVACIDLATGVGEIINAGHPAPLRLRDGVVEEVRLPADPPFGTFPTVAYSVHPLVLNPGDRLLFRTDGLQERKAAAADVAAVLGTSGKDHAREAVQLLIQAAVQASGGQLQDDAAVMCLDWHGGPARPRLAVAGAEPVG